jgi:hypothetical protein
VPTVARFVSGTFVPTTTTYGVVENGLAGLWAAP